MAIYLYMKLIVHGAITAAHHTLIVLCGVAMTRSRRRHLRPLPKRGAKLSAFRRAQRRKQRARMKRGGGAAKYLFG